VLGVLTKERFFIPFASQSVLDNFPVESPYRPVPTDQWLVAASGTVANRRNVESHRQEGAMSKANRRRYFTEAELTKLINAPAKAAMGIVMRR
jgi:hypothetical protein